MRRQWNRRIWTLGSTAVAAVMLLTACSSNPDTSLPTGDRYVEIERVADVPVGMVEKTSGDYYETTAGEMLGMLEREDVFVIEPPECKELAYLNNLVFRSVDEGSSDRVAVVEYLVYEPWEFEAGVAAREFSSEDAAAEFTDAYLEGWSFCGDGWHGLEDGQVSGSIGRTTIEKVGFSSHRTWLLTSVDWINYIDGKLDPSFPPVSITGFIHAKNVVVIISTQLDTAGENVVSLMRDLILDYANYLSE